MCRNGSAPGGACHNVTALSLHGERSGGRGIACTGTLAERRSLARSFTSLVPLRSARNESASQYMLSPSRRGPFTPQPYTKPFHFIYHSYAKPSRNHMHIVQHNTRILYINPLAEPHPHPLYLTHQDRNPRSTDLGLGMVRTHGSGRLYKKEREVMNNEDRIYRTGHHGQANEQEPGEGRQ